MPTNDTNLTSIKLYDDLAVFDEGQWTSANEFMAQSLNSTLPMGGISPSEPNPGQVAIDRAKRLFPSLKVISIAKASDEEEGVVQS